LTKTTVRHGMLLKLAIPNIITNLTVPLAGLVDVAILGHLEDKSPLAGVALGSLIFDYLFWTCGFLRMSTTGLTAQAEGAGDLSRSAAVFLRAFWTGIAIGTAILIAQSGIITLGFALLEGEAAAESAGRAYVAARIWSAPATLATMAVTGWLLGRHRVRAVLMVTATFNGLNIVLDYLFIVRFGWGAAGAGYATLSAELIALLVGLLLVRRNWKGHPIPAFGAIWQKGELLETFGLQANIMVRTFCLITAFSLFTNLSARLGTTVLIANTILLRLLNTCAYFIDGFSYSLEALAGRFAGAGDADAVRQALKLSLIWNISLVLFCNLVFLIAGGRVVGLLTIHESVIETAVVYMPYMCVALLFSGFAYIYDGLFLGLSRGKLLRNAMAASLLIGFAPFMIAAVVTEQAIYLWLAMIAFMIMRALTLGRATREL